MSKYHLHNIVGYAAAWIAGVYGSNARADYTNAEDVASRWLESKDVFLKAFDDSFQHSDSYPLWSETFPGQAKLYRLESGSGVVSFHTADDLGELKIDASLRKICRALGSRCFLAKVLDEETVDTARDEGTKPKCEMILSFTPYRKEGFFDEYGNGGIKMLFLQKCKGSRNISFNFDFAFKKEEGGKVSLAGYKVHYYDGAHYTGEVRWHQEVQPLSLIDYSENVKEAKTRINEVYRAMSKDLSEGTKKWEYKDHRAVYIDGEKPDAFWCPPVICNGDRKRASLAEQHTKMLIKILSSEAFLKEVFGEKVWDILENYNRVNRRINDIVFGVNYNVKLLRNGSRLEKDSPWFDQGPDQFEIYLRISDKAMYERDDGKPYSGYRLQNPNDWDFREEEFNSIGFRFIFDIEANEIRDVKFGKLILSGEV